MHDNGSFSLRVVAMLRGNGGVAYVAKDEDRSIYRSMKQEVEGDVSTGGQVAMGSLDSVLALTQPFVRGGGDSFPFIATSPWATDEERKVLSEEMPEMPGKGKPSFLQNEFAL